MNWMFKHFFSIGSGPYSWADSETGFSTYMEQYFAGTYETYWFLISSMCVVCFLMFFECVCVWGGGLKYIYFIVSRNSSVLLV